MSGHVLTLNAGSSSLKFGLFEFGDPPIAIATGLVDKKDGSASIELRSALGEILEDRLLPSDAEPTPDDIHAAVLQALDAHFPDRSISAVGHRVVHGGPRYAEPVVLTDDIRRDLEGLIPFAPLHQPHNLAGIAAASQAYPRALQFACFDTAFHRNHPWVNDTFALPREYYDKGIRRYGFHGLSYEYISDRLEHIAPHLHAGRVVVAHLGNGASMCALLRGRSVGSTMGLSALDGLPMGTRCGQIDPGVLLYLMDQEGMKAREIAELLYEESGLLGLSGMSSDMRTLQSAGTPQAEQALDYYVFRIRRELGALSAVLGGLDAVVFCGGIGENSAPIRQRVCENLHWLGLEINRMKNADNATVISTDLSRVRVMVVPTNEELVIAKAAVGLLPA
ncbi:MAG: acetate/propionate family kinase [Pseudomonadota bacterium]